MAKNDGGSAFPATRWDDKIRQEVPWCGMTLRDYFAAKAMQALITGSPKESGWLPNAEHTAYLIADAMLKERNK